MSLLQGVSSEGSPASFPSWDGNAQRSKAGWSVLAVVDPACIVAAAVGTGAVGNASFWGRLGEGGHIISFGTAAAVLFAAAAHLRGLYAEPSGRTSAGTRDTVLTWCLAFACLTAIALVLEPDVLLPASVLLVFFAAAGLALGAARQTLGSAALRPRNRGRRVAIVTEEGVPVSPTLCAAIGASGRRIGAQTGLPKSVAGPQFTKLAGELVDLIRRERVEEILLLVNHRETAWIGALMDQLRVVPARVCLVPDETISGFLKRPLVLIGAAHAVELRGAPLTAAQRAAKRALDLAASMAALVFLSPVFVGVALLIRLDSRGPVFFRQRRIGYNGQPFQIVKFRTMTTLDDGAVVLQACRGDRRVTRVGAFLRRYSLDELPQLLNVLQGEMSLVGPRPHALVHDAEYGLAITGYAARHNVKPGITGWAQVNGWRGETAQLGLMVRRVEHDLWYVENWSLWLDVRILFATVFVAAGGKNAY
jgi:putative colanic acid biosynthesis UDP-glucose lipid carrier transferase